MFISVIHNLSLKSLKFLFVIIVLSIYSNKIYCYENETDSIFFLIYNQEFSTAEAALSHSRNNLNPLIYNLLNTDLIWWKAISSNKEKDFKILEKDLSKKLSNTGKLASENKLEELVYLNYLIRLMSIRNQYLKMFGYFIQINSLIETVDNSNFSEEERNIFEIYKAIFYISKSKLVFTKPQYKYDNIEILKGYMESSSLVNKTISCYFLAKIYSEIEKSPEQTLQYYNHLCNIYPNNKIFRNELSLILQKIKVRIKT